SYYATGRSFSEASDGGFILAGVIDNPLSMWQSLAIKTDSEGNAQWNRLFGSDAQKWVSAVRVTDDDGYIFCGSSLRFPDYMGIYKTNGLGEFTWEQTFSLQLYTDGADIIQTSDGGFAAIGTT